MSPLQEIQNWFHSQCNGDWEHSYGIKIETLDNPGWHLTIFLEGTDLEDCNFAGHSYGVGSDAKSSADEWIACQIEDRRFEAYGGPHKLEEMIKVFLDWKDTAASGNTSRLA